VPQATREIPRSQFPHPRLGEVRHEGCPGRRGLRRCCRRDRAHSPQSLTAFSLPVAACARALASPDASSPRLMHRRPPGVSRWSVRRAYRPHRGRRASPQAPHRRGARVYAGAFAGCRADRSPRMDLATIDAHRAAVAPADLKCRLDDSITCETRRDRFEICDFPGRAIAYLLVRLGSDTTDAPASPSLKQTFTSYATR
jgi:hypothetical protein